MQITGSNNHLDLYRFGFDYIDTILKQRSVATSRKTQPVSNGSDQSVHIMLNAIRMRKALEGIRPVLLEPQEINLVSPASANSISQLGLDTTGTAATVQSTEEVNATPTSFTPFGPDWTGGSSAQATISGVYDGSNGADTLTFKVKKSGTHGQDNLQIRVTDSSNNEIDKIDINKNDVIDRQYTLSNGLVLTLGDGDLAKNDTFSVDVSDSVGSAVDPDKSFNAVRNDNPNLEYGRSVTSGSFQVNGVDISVSEDDTINTVLDRINQSDAGVTAAFDAATEKVLLTQNTIGSAHAITLGNDTSGFLAAVKLDGAVPVAGQDPDTQRPLAEVPRFSSVQSGAISVNGVSVTIDVNTDSLTDVLDRITSSNAEVSATFDGDTQRVSLTSDDVNNQLILESGTTNFFSALEITDGTYNSVIDLIHAHGVSEVQISNLLVESLTADRANNSDQTAASGVVSGADAHMLGTMVNIIAESMNALFDDSAFRSSPTAMLEQVRNDIRGAVSTAFGSKGPSFETDFGININFEKPSEGVFNFSQDDQAQLGNALTTPEGLTSVQNMFLGGESGGLLGQMHSVMTAAESGLENEVGSTGLFLDVMI